MRAKQSIGVLSNKEKKVNSIARQSSKKAAFATLERKPHLLGVVKKRGGGLRSHRSFLRGFTIVELLTVMSIIVILISILVPGLNMARRFARKVTQKNQFRGIGIALDHFNVEEEGYPDSKVLPAPGQVNCTTGAHRLAEALVGRDLQGFDPFSTWDAQADRAKPIYGRGSAPEIDASLDRRRGPYLTLDDVGAFQISELYGPTTQVYDGSNQAAPAPVLTDAYRIKTVVLPNGKIAKSGSPILYYKANVSSNIFDPLNPRQSIYNREDNEALLGLGKMLDPTEQNPLILTPQTFYATITNPQIRPSVRPYNQDSFILISAGYDGLYGTRDDVVNFRK